MVGSPLTKLGIAGRGNGPGRGPGCGPGDGPPLSDGPVNLSNVDVSPERLAADAAYGASLAKTFGDWVSNAGGSILGKRCLELGPGLNYAGALSLLARGAESVAVADRWLSPWRDEYHRPLYEKMSEELMLAGREDDARVFTQAAREGHAALLTEIARSAEDLGVPDASFDMVFSNAVLEHLADHERAIAELGRVTAPNGWHFHQVDYRDHGNFDRPLDHLMLTPEAFQMRAEGLGEPFSHGCQWRFDDHIAMFERAGFSLVMANPDDLAQESYLDEVLPLVHAQKPREVLCVLGTLLIFRKRPAAS